MANIINIDTSSSVCSAALGVDGEVAVGFESAVKMDHSSSLAPFVSKCLDFLRDRNLHLDAVAVTIGPGSYTGLRIGLSLAKGLSFGFEVPLITLSSLKVMAVRALFSYYDFSGDELIIPMIDARRLEVYTAVFTGNLEELLKEQPIILNETSFDFINKGNKTLIIGDGSEKFRPLAKLSNVEWLGQGMPHAKYMVTLAEKYYREGNFSDTAYTVPNYLKEYQATTPKTLFPGIS